MSEPKCGTCGEAHCKLWRYAGCSHVDLRCAVCAGSEAHLVVEVAEITSDGYIFDPSSSMRIDGMTQCIGPWVPAVAAPEGGWFGHIAGTAADNAAWDALPSLPGR